ncbi:MAG: hypothetical protein PHQ87_08375 [Hydrogenophaga sp.]|uniref:hypothetical protein n=1 Tax=Hydrogenophaga sp. TaxID=1904254 RepID=UPI00261B789C|nr:hypothetical protein [Hydrogenophaga sp.]MDD3785551.1 hypothetical protein [Hydrogenophaga sp.]
MEYNIKGFTLLVDDQDIHLIDADKLIVNRRLMFARQGRYAVHALIMGVKPGSDKRVIAVNGNLLDCRRSNLTLVQRETRQECIERLRARHQREIEQAREKAQTLTRLPSDFPEWGVLKIQCWKQLHSSLIRQLNRKTPNLAKLRSVTEDLSELSSWNTERCAKFLNHS